MAQITNPLRVDVAAGTITIMTKPFAESAFRYGTPEYKMLQEVRRDYPDFRVKVRQIRKNPSQRRYANLTYDRMREYVEKHDPDGLALYDTKVELAQFRTSDTRYPSVKKWFLERYPEIKASWVEPTTEAEAENAPVIEAVVEDAPAGQEAA